MATTSRLSLRYPVASDTADVPRDIGNLASDLDNAAIFSKGTLAARPTSTVGSPGIDGRYYYATDNTTLYLDTGTSWVTVGGVADGSVTDAKLGAALADNLAITNGSSTRRGSAIDATERTTTSTSYVDVTNMSVTFHVATGSISLIYVTFDAKATSFGICNARVVVGSSAVSFFGDPAAVGTTNVSQNIGANGTVSYITKRAISFINSATTGTGAQTVKLQFSVENNSGGTGYIKNCQLFAFNYTV